MVGGRGGGGEQPAPDSSAQATGGQMGEEPALHGSLVIVGVESQGAYFRGPAF